MSGKDDYELRRPRPDDLPALQVFADEVWPGAAPGKLARRWWWRGTDAPQSRIAVHRSTGAIAALCGERRTPLLVRGERLSAAAICDWNVSRSHEGRGLGRALVESIGADHDVLYTASISGSATTAFRRLGWRGEARLPVFLGNPAIVATTASLVLERDDVDAFEVSASASDPLAHVDAIDGSASVRIPRDAAFLRSHLALVPHRRYRLHVAARRGSPTGYALVRVLPRGSVRRFPHAAIGCVADLHVPDGSRGAIAGLFRSLALELAGRGVLGVMVLATEPRLRIELARLGLVSESTQFVGSRLRALSLGAMHHAPRDLPDFRDGWQVTFVDDDMDLTFGADLERSDPPGRS